MCKYQIFWDVTSNQSASVWVTGCVAITCAAVVAYEMFIIVDFILRALVKVWETVERLPIWLCGQRIISSKHPLMGKQKSATYNLEILWCCIIQTKLPYSIQNVDPEFMFIQFRGTVRQGKLWASFKSRRLFKFCLTLYASQPLSSYCECQFGDWKEASVVTWAGVAHVLVLWSHTLVLHLNFRILSLLYSTKIANPLPNIVGRPLHVLVFFFSFFLTLWSFSPEFQDTLFWAVQW